MSDEQPTYETVFHQIDPGRTKLLTALAAAVYWAIGLALFAAIPCIVWLWRWAW